MGRTLNPTIIAPLALASEISIVDQEAHAIFSTSYFEDLVNLIPAAWLNGNAAFKAPTDYRRGYVDFLSHRLQVSEIFVEEAVRARSLLI